MNLEEIRELIRLMKENQLSEIEIEAEGTHVHLKTPGANPPPIYLTPPAMGPMLYPPGTALPYGAHESPGVPEQVLGRLQPVETPEAEMAGSVVVRSPIVGLFHRAPSPDKPPFVEVGDTIDEDTVLCIIEAMKVMNEIKAETRGMVRQVLIETGQPVEFGQPLFVIDAGE